MQIKIPPLNTTPPPEDQLAAWEKQMWDKGYLVIPQALNPEATAHFLDRLTHAPYSVGYASHSTVRMFERGMDFVSLLENQPVFSLAERLVGANMHIMGFQGHRMAAGSEILSFHSDELYVKRRPEHDDSVPYPPIISAINCHYYLTDVPHELGPTWVVPYSHTACRQPRPSDGVPPAWQGHQAIELQVKAGDCVIYSNQLWHAGSKNQTNRTRYSVVPTYAQRHVAQRFWPFLNYNLSRDILDQCTPRQRQLLGEHARGAYG
jgi:ectoine hydroxylase-related dioxygenase (phytanoyl-CoA dioxygenase family)